MKGISWRGLTCFLGVLIASGPVVSGQDAPGKSPFLPDGYQAEKKAPEPQKASPVDKYELRSIMVLNGVHTFSLVDTSNKKGFWISLNETVEGVAVSDFDANDESVLVRSGGKSRRLKLKEAKIVALKVAAPKPRAAATATPAMTTGGPPTPSGRARGTTASPTINSLSDDEVRARMQRVAEEIRRRRALRRTMAEKAAQNQKR